MTDSVIPDRGPTTRMKISMMTPKLTKRFNFEQGNPGAAAGESARAQTFLLQEAMRPGVPLAFERRNGVGAVIQFEIVAGTIIGRVENGLQIEDNVPIFRLERDRDRRQLLRQPDRPERGPGAATCPRDMNQVFVGRNSPVNRNRQAAAQEVDLHQMAR